MLPSTGWDKTFNTGRGYIQGRFRSNNMLDAETEYRIQLTQKRIIWHGRLCKFRKFFQYQYLAIPIPSLRPVVSDFG